MVNKIKTACFLVVASLAVGCATKPVPESRQRQVEMINQTGIYSYQRALGPPRAR
jgi:hypothetical protein